MDFTKTIGHEKQKEYFRQAIKHNRLAHAYAFVGPEHVGKTLFATELAGMLGGDAVLDFYACDDTEGLTIEKARELQSRLNLSSASGGKKVAVISDAEKMTTEAANSLLKFLEEPPANSMIILVTSNFYGLMPTIASRVQKINFPLNTDGEVQKSIAPLALPEQNAREIILLAMGRVGLALRLGAGAEELEFYKRSAQIYVLAQSGSNVERLKAAQEVAEWEPPRQNDFLKFCMRLWSKNPESAGLGKKLLQSYHDLEYNLNHKLVIDNLFI
ncbi:AAA family ATPase [bacterium]|nr:MAG: AAA family ATPase [bacterium]